MLEEKELIEEFEKYRKNKIENFRYEHRSRLKDRFRFLVNLVINKIPLDSTVDFKGLNGMCKCGKKISRGSLYKDGTVVGSTCAKTLRDIASEFSMVEQFILLKEEELNRKLKELRKD